MTPTYLLDNVARQHRLLYGNTKSSLTVLPFFAAPRLSLRSSVSYILTVYQQLRLLDEIDVYLYCHISVKHYFINH